VVLILNIIILSSRNDGNYSRPVEELGPKNNFNMGKEQKVGSKLLEIKSLLDSGQISQEEYDQLKENIISGFSNQ
jgi:hypothetical protein